MTKGQERPASLAERELALEREKFEFEKEKFREDKKSRQRFQWSSPLVLSIIAGVAALAGNIIVQVGNGVGAYFKGLADLTIERTKDDVALVIGAIQTGNGNQAEANLQFLAKARLFNDPTKGQSILDALKEGARPVLPPTAAASSVASLPASQLLETITNISTTATCAANAGANFVARYYRTPGSGFETLTRTEAVAISAAGLNIVATWETRADLASHFTRDQGVNEGTQAFAQAAAAGQPSGSPIFFAVDYDASAAEIGSNITQYFEGIQSIPGSNKYVVGVYGSGAVIKALKSAKLVQAGWLAGATGWSGRSQILQDGNWDIMQSSGPTNLRACGVYWGSTSTFNATRRSSDLAFNIGQSAP